MPNLLPFRDYSEHEVLNFFACTAIANKGTLVKPKRSWKSVGATDRRTTGPLELGSTTPGALYLNTVTNNFINFGLSSFTQVPYLSSIKSILNSYIYLS